MNQALQQLLVLSERYDYKKICEEVPPLSAQSEEFVKEKRKTTSNTEKPIYLQVRLSFQLCELSGTVQGPNGRLISCLFMNMKGTELVDATSHNDKLYKDLRLWVELHCEELLEMFEAVKFSPLKSDNNLVR